MPERGFTFSAIPPKFEGVGSFPFPPLPASPSRDLSVRVWARLCPFFHFALFVALVFSLPCGRV